MANEENATGSDETIQGLQQKIAMYEQARAELDPMTGAETDARHGQRIEQAQQQIRKILARDPNAPAVDHISTTGVGAYKG